MKNENDVKTYEEQQTETIRERKIAVKLSDEDCDRLARLCGTHGLTIGELIENFIGDLCGTYSNGSDERMCAEQWFDRCWFGMFPEPTLIDRNIKKKMSMKEVEECFEKIKKALKMSEDGIEKLGILREIYADEMGENSFAVVNALTDYSKDFAIDRRIEIETYAGKLFKAA